LAVLAIGKVNYDLEIYIFENLKKMPDNRDLGAANQIYEQPHFGKSICDTLN
jgi:hypothetical protein